MYFHFIFPGNVGEVIIIMWLLKLKNQYRCTFIIIFAGMSIYTLFIWKNYFFCCGKYYEMDLKANVEHLITN